MPKHLELVIPSRELTEEDYNRNVQSALDGPDPERWLALLFAPLDQQTPTPKPDRVLRTPPVYHIGEGKHYNEE